MYNKQKKKEKYSSFLEGIKKNCIEIVLPFSELFHLAANPEAFYRWNLTPPKTYSIPSSFDSIIADIAEEPIHHLPTSSRA